MKAWPLVVLPGWLAIGLAPPIRPPANALHRPGETVLLAFKTDRGKTVTLCEGPKKAYLVYRFGTPAKVELQYPAVLNTGSWRKFTYFGYHRSANPISNYYRLSFSNGGVKYELYDHEEAIVDEDGNEQYPREVGLTVELPEARSYEFVANAASVYGVLRLDEEQQERVKIEGGE